VRRPSPSEAQPLHAPVERRLYDVFFWDEDRPVLTGVWPVTWDTKRELRKAFKEQLRDAGAVVD
jgi:hypothetical protein